MPAAQPATGPAPGVSGVGCSLSFFPAVEPRGKDNRCLCPSSRPRPREAGRVSAADAPAGMGEASGALLVCHAEPVQLRHGGGDVLVVQQFEGIEAAAREEEHLVGADLADGAQLALEAVALA